MLEMAQPIQAANTASVRSILRAVTWDIHQRLDARAHAFHLGTRAGYARFLAAQAEVIVPLERELEAAGVTNVLTDWLTYSRRAALLADLEDLGFACIAEPVPKLRGEAAILGALYVLEGSRLGARGILREI